MIVDQLFDNKKNINEGLADEFMAMAKAKGMNPRLRGTPDEERARTDAMLKQRAADRAAAPKPQPVDAETRAHLQDQLKSLEAQFDPQYEYSDDYSFWKEQSNIAQQIDRIKAALSRGISESRQHKLNEAVLMEDPVYRKFKTVGRYIAERKMSEKEILQVFADAEAGMTDKATGANRTFLGRGKDTATDFAGGVADALKGVWSGIQNSVPVAAVDVAYDQATDALAGLTGGQKGQVMQAIKKYRNLAKQYPKTAGLAKGALVAITGLATGGAGLPAVAALVYGLDSAIKGEKLSDIALKAGGAAATAWAGQKISSALGGDQAAGGANTNGFDPSQMPAYDDAGNLMPGFHINPESGQAYWNGELTPTPADVAAGLATDTAAGAAAGAPVSGGTYTTMAGDQGGFIAQANGVPFEQLKAANPQITNWNKLPVGTELQLPPAGDNVGSVWRDLSAAPGASTTTAPAAAATPTVAPTAASASPYGAVRGPMGLDYTSIAGIPVVPGQPLNPTQMAVADFAMQQGNKLSPVVQAAYDLAKRGAVRESVKFKTLPVDKLIDQKSTVLTWALNESVGRKSNSVSLTTLGTYTVFENVRRVAKAVNVMELKGVPGSTRPEYYRPDMPGGPGKQSKPGLIGRGLNWLDKAAGKVGGALSNFGHQFTTGVTKEKLKMNWHQAGKPSDSDALAAWLVKQGVPQEVVTDVYGKMGIPYTAPAATPAAEPAATPAAEPAAATGGAQKQMAFYGTNPATKKPWTYDELQAKARAGQAVPTAGAEPAATPAAEPAAEPSATQPTAPAPAPATFPGEDPKGPNYVGRLEVKRRQAARAAAAAAAKPAAPNFAQQGGGYAQVNQPTSVKYTGMPAAKPKAPTTATLPAGGGAGVKAAPTGTRVVSGGPTPDEQAKLAQRIAQAAKQPVAEMLAMVETKEDVQRIKQFIDQTFVKYGAVSESAFVVRNKLIEHVTQVGAQRRREFARKS